MEKPQTAVAVNIVMVSGSGTGQTTLIRSFQDQHFCPNQWATIGGCPYFYSREIDDIPLQCVMWDNGAYPRFINVLPMHLKRADILLISIDITDRRSFEIAKEAYSFCTEEQRTPSDVLLVIASTKNDLEEEREVLESDILAFCESINAPYFQTSSKTMTGINELFHGIISHAMSHKTERLREKISSIFLSLTIHNFFFN